MLVNGGSRCPNVKHLRWLAIICHLLVALTAAGAAPTLTQVSGLSEVASQLSSCGAKCVLQFDRGVVQLPSVRTLLQHNGDLEIIGAPGTGTVLRCPTQSLGAAVIEARPPTGAAAVLKLTLRNITITGCANTTSFLKASNTNAVLDNVHFQSNSPSTPLIQYSGSAAHSLQISQSSFANNTLLSDGGLLYVSNTNVNKPWGARTPALLAAVRTAWNTSGAAALAPNLIASEISGMLDSKLMDSVMDTAMEQWRLTNMNLQNFTGRLLLPVVMRNVRVADNSAAGLARFFSFNGVDLTTQQVAVLTNHMNPGADAPTATIQSEPTETEPSPTLAADRATPPQLPILFYSASGTVMMDGVMASGNENVTLLAVKTALGGTTITRSSFMNNAVMMQPFIRVEGFSLIMDDKLTNTSKPGAAPGTTLKELETAMDLAYAMFNVRDIYSQVTGKLDLDGLTRIIKDGVIRNNEHLYEVAASVGLGDQYNTKVKVEATFTTRFMVALEFAALYRTILFKRDNPFQLQRCRFVNNTIVHTPLLLMTGASMQAGTFSNMSDVMFINNVAVGADTATPNHSLIHAEYILGRFERMAFRGNTAGAITLGDSIADLTSLLIDHNAPSSPLLSTGLNVSQQGTRNLTNYVRIYNTSIDNNLGPAPLLQFGQVSLQLHASQILSNVARNASDYVLFTLNPNIHLLQCWGCKLFRFEDVDVAGNAAPRAVMHYNQTLFANVNRLRCVENKATCVELFGDWNRDLDLDGSANDIQNFTNCLFQGNVATGPLSAGLAILNTEWLHYGVLDSVFRGNQVPYKLGRASRGGAFMYVPDPVWDSKRGGYAYLRNVTFIDNSACYGGAMYLNTSVSTILDCHFSGNTAEKLGGAIFCDKCQWDSMMDNVFEHNVAGQGGAAAISPKLSHWLLPSMSKSMSIRMNKFLNNTAQTSARAPYDQDWEICPGGGGGALCILYDDDQYFEGFYIHNNHFEGNTATWGGAIMLNNIILPFNNDQCRVDMDNNLMINNKVVDGAGPVLFYNNSAGICLTCKPHIPPSPPPPYASSSLSPPPSPLTATSNWKVLSMTHCNEWMANSKHGPEAYGSNGLATFPQTLELYFCTPEASNSTDSCNMTAWVGRSGGTFSALARLVDGYGQTVPRALTNITLAINQTDDLLVYNIAPRLLDQSNSLMQNISIQSLQVPNGTTFHIPFIPITTLGFMQPAFLNLTIRKCFLGEFISDQKTCVPCDRGSFSLHPDIQCLPCTAKAECDISSQDSKLFYPKVVGMGLLVPQPGYWKTTPYSPVPHRCPLDRSCRSNSKEHVNAMRTVRLQRILTNQTYPLPETVAQDFMDSQCMSGYMGRLCGTCAPGFGRLTNRCVECVAAPFWNAVLLTLALLLVCGIVALLVWSHVKGVYMSSSGNPAESIGGVVVARSHAQRVGSMFKVLVSYVQVMAIIRMIQLDWPHLLLRLLENADITSSPAWVSLDCSMPKADPQTQAIVRTVIMTLLPVFVCAAFTTFWWAYGWSHAVSARRSTPMPWKDYCFLSVIQVCYLLYPFSTAATFSIFTCVSLDEASDPSIQEYLNQSKRSEPPMKFVETGLFWSQNYKHECYTGTHSLLAFGFGIPWVVIFTIGFPALSAYLLFKNRSNLTTCRTLLKYGFLYEEYDHAYYAWESVSMLRKACLLAVTLFMQPFGGLVQLSTGVLLLGISILLHDIYVPYRDPVLNSAERISLFANLTNLTCLIYIASDLNLQVRAAVVVILFLLNLGVIGYFIYRIAVEVRHWYSKDGVVMRRAVSHLMRSSRRMASGLLQSFKLTDPQKGVSIQSSNRWRESSRSSQQSDRSEPREAAEDFDASYNPTFLRSPEKAHTGEAPDGDNRDLLETPVAVVPERPIEWVITPDSCLDTLSSDSEGPPSPMSLLELPLPPTLPDRSPDAT